MTIDCFVPITTFRDVSPKTGLSQGLAIVQMADVRLRALVHEVDIPLISTLLADLATNVTSMSAEAEARSKARAREMSSWLDEWADRHGTAAAVETLRCQSEALSEFFVAAGRTSDLTLLALSGAPEGPAQALDLMLEIGGPLLIVPEMVVMASALESLRVCVAWDGSRAASRAVRDAMPILAAASELTILMVDGDKDIPLGSGDRVIGWLQRHGLSPRLDIRERGDAPVGDILQTTALSEGNDVLVMGAYSHSRLRELVLGGATRSVLHRLQLPVLMSH